VANKVRLTPGDYGITRGVGSLIKQEVIGPFISVSDSEEFGKNYLKVDLEKSGPVDWVYRVGLWTWFGQTLGSSRDIVRVFSSREEAEVWLARPTAKQKAWVWVKNHLHLAFGPPYTVELRTLRLLLWVVLVWATLTAVGVKWL
jgi:hypothetical protein